MRADDVIALLGLEPLPGEGGWFRQTWIAPGDNPAAQPAGTAIFYLVTPDSWSALHRLRDDEIYHFYLGDPCIMLTASPAGELIEVRLGTDIGSGEQVQYVVPAGWWQGTQLAPGGAWALLGTTMAPGFHSDRFELARPDSLATFNAATLARLTPWLP